MKPITVEEARAKRDDGIRRADDNADEDWKEHAFLFLETYCREHETVFCDDLWAAGLEPPREGRALGAVMQRAARAGLMRRSGTYRKSVRSNMTPKPVWLSLVWRLPT